MHSRNGKGEFGWKVDVLFEYKVFLFSFFLTNLYGWGRTSSLLAYR